MTKPQQLLLDLPHRSASGRDDFLVAAANASAVELIDQWPQWPAHAAILVGPEGAGKSHLAQVWCAKAQATAVRAHDLELENIPELFHANALCIEALDAGHINEYALFHALNFARQEQGSILLTSRAEPSQINFNLPDLISRLRALPMVHILPPDDLLLRSVLVKLFADRQISVDDALINFIILRMPRSLGAARQLVNYIDKQALIEKADVTRPFVARVIGHFLGPDLFNAD